MGGKTSGSGNAAWRAAVTKTRFRRGHAGLRKCQAEKRSGGPCGKIAVRGLTVCYTHGGALVLLKRQRAKAKANGNAWTREIERRYKPARQGESQDGGIRGTEGGAP
jgi:hypothetical protein